jgi:hypothetical protein
MEKKDKIYGGSSRVIQTKYGPLTTVSQSKRDLQNLLAYLNEKNLEWVNLNIVKNKEQVPNKPSHHLVVNIYTPGEDKKVDEPTNEFPF